ncbi:MULTISPECIES: sugar ABC transporter ATP-binding protein [unclassified Oceanispirochaeta]|uniref:sugar ABC transporter ATP-binding protein n=1 Tax=unclassified Oceanispirochaeta TaxID=2635722 RepID=UPI000E09CDC8|nr:MULTISPECIES: sugar ABC transporter ATP-binding protein [unclassified Oceanispirochaeta]MBF9017962.1 sugar ABC transporter ATP-binding protein [Oceanispirochaeta sp. M2]NPD74473.1 sugar ABC transporter ATP-binding protein [Oceanispirochaeta sp. M1]RDG29681.1 sugar ABC transporter ATP-binding protein [Oceanispirochaeta sp. M1]
MDSKGLMMKGISMDFPGVKALDGVDFSANKGEVHALIGANGAGKSTLMKILSGVYVKTSGEIFINGQKLDIQNPMDAKKNGIVIVYQEVDTALIPYLTVAENIMMDYLITEQKSLFIDWRKIQGEAKEAMNKLGLDIDVNRLVSDLTLSEKQMVLIGRAVFHKAEYLILDEPTAPLSVEETDKLFEIVETVKKRGVSVIFISHRLDEIFKICERITVLRDGKLVGDYDIKTETIDTIVEKMLGRKLESTFPKHDITVGGKIFEVRHISGDGGINDVNMHVNAGEIVGVSGLVGAGKTELMKLLFGASKRYEGEVAIHGNLIAPKSPAAAVKKGLALVPEERRREGIIVQESIETNATLPTLKKYCNGVFMNRSLLKKSSCETIEMVGIKAPNEKVQVSKLSGGNQQKVAIGKWIISDAEIFMFDEPTKGVDVGSKAEIYKLIGGLVAKDKGVIYATCEFSEILGLTDRVYVMYNGTIAAELITKNTNEEELLRYSTGGGRDE